MKKGFTLIELLAVLVIIGLLTIIVIPSIVSSINFSKESSSKKQKQLIEQSARNYMAGKRNTYLPGSGKSCFVKITKLQNCGLLAADLKDPKNGNSMNGYVKVSGTVTNGVYKYTYEYSESKPASTSCDGFDDNVCHTP